MSARSYSMVVLVFLGICAVGWQVLGAARPAAEDPQADPFAAKVRPFLDRYCLHCHGPKKREAELDLSRDTTERAVVQNSRQWELVLDRLHSGEMPPEDAPRQPKPEERAAIVRWLRELQDREAERLAGDPGIVLAHRLSNAEYDYTIRDLTGVDLRPTREFPVDPANEAGFDNSGESLAMSPALMKKYLAAARFVADHLVLKAEGFAFASHPMITDTDRDKYAVQRIVAFYQRQAVDYADYFLAAWHYQHRKLLDKPTRSLQELANERALNAGYLARIWELLSETDKAAGPLGELQTEWAKLPGPAANASEPRRECEQLRDLVLKLRKELAPRVDRLSVRGISQGSQPLLLWRNDQLAAQHRVAPEGSSAAQQRFCSVFPDTFVVLERAPYYDPGSSARGRYLSAGFHLMHGYYRDDAPLYELILNEKEQKEIDILWEELHFITTDAARQYKDFIFFERAEPPRFMFEEAFDFARSEDKDAISQARIDQLREVYLAKARKSGGSNLALKAIDSYFREILSRIRRTEQARKEAEPSHLASLQEFAERAYRRPLSASERTDLLKFYGTLREKDQLVHEDALRDTISSILLSPQFCYRLDLGKNSSPLPGESPAVPLNDFELASRLSYFLWSSMPDAELMAHARTGDLHDSRVLQEQVRRMLRDARVRGLATEFGGNWLDFRRFEEHQGVDRARFPSFTGALRQAMFEEPIRYFMDVAQHNRSVLDFLYGKDTFVNRTLAKHYGMPEPATEGEWVHIDDAEPFGRGGLLPMAVFQTRNSPGLRTSPVKRGYWVVRRVLGERIPPPPPTVPELPKDESSLGELSLPQLLARHRADKSCAACHRRFDSVGLVFEGYGPIGERRQKDLSGHPVENSALFPDGHERMGLAGLQSYLREQRQEEFIENLCKKLFSYALGRSLLPSDRKTLETMRALLTAEHHTLESLVQSIVSSPQFLRKRSQ